MVFVLMSFTVASLFLGLIQGLLVTPTVTMLLYKKQLGPCMAWVFGPAIVVAIVAGPIALFLSPLPIGVTIVFATVVLRFALRDWVADWRCQSCCYDLRGSAAHVCPECGNER